MKNILVVIGTRPEAIKLAPVIKELEKHSASLRSIVCSTGQHQQLLNNVFKVFNIRPSIELAVMTENQSLSTLTARLITTLTAVCERDNYDWMVAQGDTTTVLAASLVSFYLGIPFAHVEAGLRSRDLHHPFPEEFNRRVADQLAQIMFAPTEQNRQVLLAEGASANSVFVTGNTVIDAMRYVLQQRFSWHKSQVKFLAEADRVILVTAHRRESFGEPLREIYGAVRELAKKFASSEKYVGSFGYR